MTRLTTKGEYTITEPRLSVPEGDEELLSYWSNSPENGSHTLTKGGGQRDWYVLIYRTSSFGKVVTGDECVKYLGEQVTLEIPTDAMPLPSVEELVDFEVEELRTEQVSEVSVVTGPSEFWSMERFIFADLESQRTSDLAAYPAGSRPAKIRRRKSSRGEDNPTRTEIQSELRVLTDRRPLYASMQAATGTSTFHVYNFHAPYKNVKLDPDWSMRAFAAYSFRDVAESQVQSGKDNDVIIFLGDFNLDKDRVRSSFFDQLSNDMKGGWEHVHNKVFGLSGFDHILVRPMSTNWEGSLKQVPYWTQERKSKKQEVKGLAEQVREKASSRAEEESGKVYKFETGVGKEFLSDHLWVVADLEFEETSLVGAKRKRGPAR